jgi:mitochondrial fission protein ELM1
MKIYIICLLSSLIGDMSNVRGVTRSMYDFYASKQLIIHEIKANEVKKADALIRTFKDADKIVVIGAGADTLAAALTLKNSFKDKIYVAWSGHQLPEEENLLLIDRINLPKGIAPDILKNSGHLTETIGVPHNLTKADLKNSLEEWSDKIPVTNKKKLVLILGGDAPLSDGKTQKLYTAKEAEELADYIEILAKKDDYFVYITNGPRTGKFNNHTMKENNTAHRGSADISEPTDSVSAAFLNRLRSKNFKDFYFADFRYATPSISAYKPFLGLLERSDLLILPGESVSMFSETIGLTNNRIGYITGSMNNAHYKTMEGFKKESHISILSLPVTAGIYDLEKSAIAGTAEEPEPAAMTFAKAIKADLESIEITGLQR